MATVTFLEFAPFLGGEAFQQSLPADLGLRTDDISEGGRVIGRKALAFLPATQALKESVA